MKTSEFRSRSEPEIIIDGMLSELKLNYEREFIIKPRRYRYDFAILDEKIVIEVEGGVWQLGRHQKPLGFIKDCHKYLYAQMNGWKVIRIPSAWLNQKFCSKNTDSSFNLIQLKKIIFDLCKKKASQSVGRP